MQADAEFLKLVREYLHVFDTHGASRSAYDIHHVQDTRAKLERAIRDIQQRREQRRMWEGE